MQRTRALIAACLFPPLLLAHGGQYRGPGEVLPAAAPSSSSKNTTKGAAGGAGATSSGSGSSTNGASAPGPGAASGPASPSARGIARGAPLDDDLTRWDFWWEFRKDSILRVREHQIAAAQLLADPFATRGAQPIGRDPAAPTAADIERLVVPALDRALQSASDRDTITACLVALAKIGRDLPTRALRDAILPHLRSHDQEVRETAALCLGIARCSAREDLDLLLALTQDQEAGRVACGRAQVDERTRAFAGYALGLILEDARDGAVRQRILLGLLPLLQPGDHGRDLTVAAIAAIARLPEPQGRGQALMREAAVHALLDYFDRDLGPGEQLLQAHCPPAIAQLTGRDSDSGRRAARRFADELANSLAPEANRRSSHHLAQSCALALGDLLTPWVDETSPDAAPAKLLLRTARGHKDTQTRFFALLALGRIGGAAARDALVAEFGAATKSIERPWVTLALGLYLAGERDRQRHAGKDATADAAVAELLTTSLADTKNPSALGATAIALGLIRHEPAAPQLHRLLQEYRSRDDLAGQLGIGLAMLGDHDVRNDLRDQLPRSLRRPELLVQIATALGRLGDPAALDDLLGLLRESDGSLARLSALAMAIGQIGDRRALPTLLTMLANPDLIPLTRAFAAVALGGACDPRPLPWNAAYSRILNYRAAVETLTDGAAGILDIL